MCEIVSGQEQFLEIPANLVQNKQGVAIDIGASALKGCYTTQEGDKLRIHFFTYANERVDEGLALLKKQSQGMGDGGKFFKTGIGATVFQEKIESTLNKSFTSRFESDCVAAGLLFLAKHYALEEFVQPESEAVTEFTTKVVAQLMAIMSAAKAQFDQETSLVEATEVPSQPAGGKTLQFPVLVAQIGSAGAAYVLEEDGKVKVLETIHTCGRYLMGVGSMLTGSKTFEELASFAERGNRRKVDIMMNDMGMSKSEDVYAQSTNLDVSIYSFGHCSGKRLDEFQKEDLAASLLDSTSQSIAQFFQMIARLQKIKDVVFIGGLCNNSQFVRDQIGKYFALKSAMNSEGFQTNHYFVKLASYLGCLGALLKGLELVDN